MEEEGEDKAEVQPEATLAAKIPVRSVITANLKWTLVKSKTVPEVRSATVKLLWPYYREPSFQGLEPEL